MMLLERMTGGKAVFVCMYQTDLLIEPLNTSLQAVGCSIRLGQKTISTCSLYLPPNETLQYAQLENLIQQLPQPLLLCTDANSRQYAMGLRML